MANILIVDDTYYNHRLIRLILNAGNHRFSSARNGLEALQLLSKDEFDLIITDIHMPEMDGFSLLDCLKSDFKFNDLPVIVITASGQEMIGKTAVEKGANGFLTQPFSSWELRNLVSECL
jgi:CheY-like chemotaxis protein